MSIVKSKWNIRGKPTSFLILATSYKHQNSFQGPSQVSRRYTYRFELYPSYVTQAPFTLELKGKNHCIGREPLTHAQSLKILFTHKLSTWELEFFFFFLFFFEPWWIPCGMVTPNSWSFFTSFWSNLYYLHEVRLISGTVENSNSCFVGPKPMTCIIL